MPTSTYHNLSYTISAYPNLSLTKDTEIFYIYLSPEKFSLNVSYQITKHSLSHERCCMSWDGIHQSDPRHCGDCFRCHSCHVCCHELSRTCFHGHHFYRNHRRGNWNHVVCRQPCKERNDPWISIKKIVSEFVLKMVFHLVSSLTPYFSSIWHEEERLRKLFTS